MTITDALAAEHTVFLSLFDQVERALPTLTTVSQIKALARIVEGILKSHAEAESGLAYLALDHVLANKGQLEVLHQDHHELDAQLAKVQGAKTCAEARRLLAGAMKASRAHFYHEETTVFPLLEKLLKRETLRELGRTRLQRNVGLSAAQAG
jgi:hypothetical protein